MMMSRMYRVACMAVVGAPLGVAGGLWASAAQAQMVRDAAIAREATRATMPNGDELLVVGADGQRARDAVASDANFQGQLPAPPMATPEVPPPPPPMPQSMWQMLEAAAATNEDATVDTVARLAKQTQPHHEQEINAFVAAYRDRARNRRVLAETARREAIAERGVLDGWGGQIQAGASRATGNTRTTALTGSVALNRPGNNWDYKFLARADYQSTRGVTTQERYLVQLSPQYRFDERLFAYGLGRWESDRFQGFDTRWTASGGVGFQAVNRDGKQLNLRAGPALRYTDVTLDAHETSLAWLTESDFKWQVTPTLRLAQTGSALFETYNNTFATTASLDARLIGALSARLAYTLEHNTSPVAGSVKTDTMSRFTLVYDF